MTVYLVGAGPGDPGLMTVRALELIAAADVIVHDRLIPASALDGARADARVIYAGKEGGGEQVPQQEITRLLVRYGQSAETVVRLKGGDPFVFGRGGEEAEALLEAGIAFEVVPGVTSGIAAPAYAGIPVTHRDAASSVAFLTGHEDPDKPESALDWSALASFPGTLIVYMGMRQLPAITAQLIAGGRAPQEPAALVHRGTLPEQRSATGTLATIAQIAHEQQIKAPTIAIFGPVAALGEKLAWLQHRPLHGATVAVTRAREQASRLAQRLRGLGAEVVVAPVIRTRNLPGPVPELHAYDLICFTSPNGVQALFARLESAGLDARAFPDSASARVAAIGPATARALQANGIRADVMPEQAVGEALAQALAGIEVTRALVARAREARDVVPDALRARGVEVDVLPVYETVVERLDAGQLEAVAAADFLTFTSASTVRNFLESVGGAQAWIARGAGRPRMVSIGPVTSEELRRHGLEPDVEATNHDSDGLITAIIGRVSDPSRRPVVTLLTDYGITDEFAGVIAGVISKICPDARIINLTHGIVRHDIRGGAMTLAQSLPYMPTGVHLAVVDPTVGGDRRAVALQLADERYLVGPDNGLLWPAVEFGGGVESAVEISHSRWRLEPVSATFHGRDIFAPVAAHLAAGDPLDEAGERISPETLIRLEAPRPWMEGGALVVTVNNADRFGNLQLAARVDDLIAAGATLGDHVQIRLASGQLHNATFSRTFSDVGEGELIVYDDSAHRLALGCHQGSAMVRLGLRPEDTMRITVAHDA